MTDATAPLTNSRSLASEGNVNEQVNSNEIWAKVSDILKNLVSDDAYHRWFESAEIITISETEAILAVASDMHQVWIETNYLPEVQSAISQVCDMPLKVKIHVSQTAQTMPEDQFSQDKQDEKRNTSEPNASVQFTGNTDSSSLDCEVVFGKKLKQSGLNPQFGFDRFVVGQNNEFAHAACMAVASAKSPIYNPLFIHGSSGLGKTHLMQAIGQRLMKNNPSARVVYLTCEKFINEFIDTVRKGSLEKFRKKYRRADILLIDDIQFLGGKERSQEEFFHTFNELLDLQSQVVITSDRPASEIKNIEPRLISRFESGLTVELQPPGMETRLAILQRKMDEWDVKVNNDILTMLAERIQSNVRRLEGGLVRIATYASLGNEQVTQDRAEFLLKDILREEGQKKVNIDAIQKAVTDEFDIRLADMTSRRRPTNIAFPRQIAMYLSRKLTPSSLIEIGDAFGGRDHGTVIYACRKVEARIKAEPQIKDSVDMLINALQRK